MKLKLIVSIIRNNKYLLSSFIISGSVLISPFSLAAIHSNTVNLNNTTIVSGDSIVTGNSTALSSTVAGGAALDLSGSSASIEINVSLPNQFIYGANLANKQTNNFGNGSTILITQNNLNSGSGYIASGVQLGDATNLTASGLNIEINAATTTQAKGIVGNGHNNIQLGDNTVININDGITGANLGGLATGISLSSTGQLMANALELNINALNNASGINSSGANVDLGNNSKINVTTTSTVGVSTAVYLSSNSVLNANALQITGQNAQGISANGTSTLNLGSNSSVFLSGASNSGISTNGTDVNINANQLTISVNGDNAYGLNLNNGSHITNLGSHSTITTAGANASGIWMVGRKDGLLTADVLTIHTTGSNASALDVRSGNAIIGDGSLLMAEKAGTLVASASSGSPASITISNSKLISGGSYAASAQQTGATVTLNNIEATVDRLGNRAYALWAVSGGIINANSIKVDAATGVYGMVANGGGKINLSGQVVINSIDAAMIADSSTSYIKGSGQMSINGLISAQNSGTVDLAMTSGSILNGSVNQSNSGVANLSIDNGIWQFDSNSNVNNLALTNNTNVIFNTISSDVTRSSASDGLLTVNNLTGNGLFTMRANNIVNGSGDLLNITGSSAGQHAVKVINNGSLATDGTETLTVITTADGVANFALTNQVELGGYLYNLRQIAADSNNWELYASGLVPVPTPPDNGNNNNGSGGGSLTPSADASANMLNASYLMNYAETQTLLQRMGDLRQGGDNGNVWARTFYGKFSSFDSGKLHKFDMDYHGLQIGADKAWVDTSGTLYSGVFASLSDSNQNYERGDGSIKSQSVGMYGSYILNSGTYLDVIAKYQHYRNKLNITDTLGNGVGGKGSSSGIALSVEGGHRFHINADQSGLYIEPQLQLSYAHQGSNQIENSNGLAVDLDGYHSLLGRAGALIGYQVNPAEQTPINLYFKNSWLQEFKGDTSYHLNGNKEGFSFKGGAWVSGVGVSAQLQKQHTLFLDMEKTTGNKFNQNQINVGYRYSF